MYGNWRFNIISGLVGSIFVFLVALTNNPIYISLFRALYSFVAFFLIAYAIRFIIGTYIFPKEKEFQEIDVEKETLVSGQNVDFIAHEQDENLQDLLKQQLANKIPTTKQAVAEKNDTDEEQPSFKPLKPTQLFSNKSVQPEEMSKAIRHLTGE